MKNQEKILTDSLEFWRDEFQRLYKIAPEFKRNNLIIYDSYFLTAVGKDDVRNVKNNKASYEKTRRVVLALTKYVESIQDESRSAKKLLKRQKLVQ